jgi:hypothetical protein
MLIRDHGGKQTESEFRDAMGCEWMRAHDAREAIPPAYAEFIGKQALQAISTNASSQAVAAKAALRH